MSNLDKLASKFSEKYAQTAPAAPVVPAAVNQNYVNMVNEFQRMMTNLTAGLGEEAGQKALALVMPYKNTAASTSPENAKLIAKGLQVNLNEVQTNLNNLKSLVAAVLAGA